jgi:hypothetical protein
VYKLITHRRLFDSDFSIFKFATDESKRALEFQPDWLPEPLKTSYLRIINDAIQVDDTLRPGAESIEETISGFLVQRFSWGSHFDARSSRVSRETVKIASSDSSVEVEQVGGEIQSVTIRSPPIPRYTRRISISRTGPDRLLRCPAEVKKPAIWRESKSNRLDKQMIC